MHYVQSVFVLPILLQIINCMHAFFFVTAIFFFFCSLAFYRFDAGKALLSKYKVYEKVKVNHLYFCYGLIGCFFFQFNIFKSSNCRFESSKYSAFARWYFLLMPLIYLIAILLSNIRIYCINHQIASASLICRSSISGLFFLFDFCLVLTFPKSSIIRIQFSSPGDTNTPVISLPQRITLYQSTNLYNS